jgi:hypothetical protein
MVSRTKERALDPLYLVHALPALATSSICQVTSWLRGACPLQATPCMAQHPCSSTAVRATLCRQLCQSLRALKSCLPLAPSQPHSCRVMAEHV